MNKPTVAELFHLLLIAAVGLAGSAFFWYYAVQLKPAAPTVQIAYHRPYVLGAYAEKNQVGEETTGLSAAEVQTIYESYCHRLPSEQTIEQWIHQSAGAFRAFLENYSLDTEVNCAK